LVATVAIGGGHTLWQHGLYYLVLVTGIPSLVYLLGTAIHQVGRWLGGHGVHRIARIGNWLGRHTPTVPRHPAILKVLGTFVVGVVILGGAALGILQDIEQPTTTGQLVATLAVPGSNAYIPADPVVFSPDGKTLAVADCVGDCQGSKGAERVYLWNMATRTLTTTLAIPPNDKAQASTYPVIAFSPHGKFLAVADTSSDVTYIWDMTSGRFVMQLAEPSRATLNYVAFSPDGKLIATCDNNGSVTLWDTTTGRIIASATDPNSDTGVSAVAFSQDGQFLAIGEQSGRIALYNLARHTISAAVTDPGKNPDIGMLTFSPNGKFLATADLDGSTYVWNVATSTLLAVLTSPGSKANNGSLVTAFSPNGDTITTGAGNGNAYIWSLVTRKIIASFISPSDYFVVGLAFTPDGKVVAIDEYFGGAYLWEPS
jgi:WD40 repeat protein